MTNIKKKSASTDNELDVEAVAQMFITNYELLAERGLSGLAVVRDKVTNDIVGIRIVLPVNTWRIENETDLVFDASVDGV